MGLDKEVPRKGTLAYSEMGVLGLITSDRQYKVQFGHKTMLAWTGIQLEHNPGGEWFSEEPIIVGHVDDFIKYFYE